MPENEPFELLGATVSEFPQKKMGKTKGPYWNMKTDKGSVNFYDEQYEGSKVSPGDVFNVKGFVSEFDRKDEKTGQVKPVKMKWATAMVNAKESGWVPPAVPPSNPKPPAPKPPVPTHNEPLDPQNLYSFRDQQILWAQAANLGMEYFIGTGKEVKTSVGSEFDHFVDSMHDFLIRKQTKGKSISTEPKQPEDDDSIPF
jgi:hypothetical protein